LILIKSGIILIERQTDKRAFLSNYIEETAKSVML